MRRSAVWASALALAQCLAPANAADLATLLESVREFRVLASRDAARAAAKFATPEARRTIAEIDRRLWLGASPQVGWSFLYSTSSVTVGALESATPTVAFYHPWSDVFVLTSWRSVAGTTRFELIDVAVAPGESIRDGDEGIRRIEPAWLVSPTPPPAGLLVANATTIAAFELRVPLQSPEDWRAAMPHHRGEFAERSLQAAALRVDAMLRSFAQLAAASRGEPAELATLRVAIGQALRMLGAGQVTAWLAVASGTPAETGDMLRALPPARLARLQPLYAVRVAKARTLVLLVEPGDPDRFFAIEFEQRDGVLQPRRVDWLSFAIAYRDLGPAPAAGTPAGKNAGSGSP